MERRICRGVVILSPRVRGSTYFVNISDGGDVTMQFLRELRELRDAAHELREAVARAESSRKCFEERARIREAENAARLAEARRAAREEFARIDPEAFADAVFGRSPPNKP